ncbi:hemerythrin domain-containing protein [Microbispora catharanthi]|uniref:Hemerythrin domain-containing protein n=1 Tax=Microbispora catharanthi TaxID=1712871 RepID=A0A5N6BLN8_9ACTN|nr:hemerythrin domain-containing protein [Microbispora catharanthi]KAB8181200.1 hemerythrin domain-containing protein [Microbispora catharanthi]
MRRRPQVLTEVREAPAPQERKTATRVLVEHHEVLRGLMRRLMETPRPEPGRRRALADELFDELWMHERIEEEVFYPAMRDVTPGIAAAWSEHRQLSDQLAALVRADPRTERFDRELGVMHDALESHAHLDEERQMFPEIERFADEERLIELGDRLQARLGRLRSSRRVRAVLRLQRALLRRTAR